jgi:autotransporter translocation and assembly factor TamB
MRTRYVLLSCLLAAAAFAADATGKWTAEVTGRQGNMQTVTMNLKADGTTLTGSVQGARGGTADIQDGKVDGDKVSFTVTRKMQDNEIKIMYEGTVAGSTIKFKMHPEPAPDRVTEFTAKRAE